MFTLPTSRPGQNPRPQTTVSPAQNRSSGLLTLMLLITGLLLIISLAGCKKKPNPEASPSASSASGSSSSGASTARDTHISDSSEQALGKDQSGSLADRLNAVQSGEADKPGLTPPPNLKPFPADVKPPEIPMVPHVMLNGTISPAGKAGDDDHETEITAVTASTVTVNVGKTRRHGDSDEDKNGLNTLKTQMKPGCDVTIDRVDLAKGYNYRPFVCAKNPDHVPGTDSLGLSIDAFKQLRAGQPTEFHFNPDTENGGDLSMVMQTFGPKGNDGPKVTQRAGMEMYGCTLHRVESFDLAWAIMLNDKPVDVPVVHAMCKWDDGDESHIYILDQADNPLAMFVQLGIVPEIMGILQVNLPPADEIKAFKEAESDMEKKLQDKKPVEIYGIYFDTASAVIKPKSEAVLKQIAEIMQRNPGWKLNVSGHTDNIGTDASNQTLSEQRAAAVKDALVSRYKISADRLSTAGHGASQPVASNDTMIGRAKNRRVELQRQ